MKPVKLFSLLPQKSLRAMNIKLDTTVLRELHHYLEPDMKERLLDQKLWERYFNLGSFSGPNDKVFENFIPFDNNHIWDLWILLKEPIVETTL